MTIIYHIRPRFPRAKLHEIPAVKLCKTQIHREMGKKALTEVKIVDYNNHVAARISGRNGLYTRRGEEWRIAWGERREGTGVPFRRSIHGLCRRIPA